MSLATDIAPGDIVLNGDFAGSSDGHAPELSSTGVIPGTYVLPNIVVDCKGRVTYADNFKLSVASDTDLGGVIAPGGELKLDVAQYATPCGTGGVVQVGDNINVDAGVISVESFPIATTTYAGLVQIGNNINLDSAVISLPIASTTQIGIAQLGNGFTSVDDIVHASDATTSTKGVITVDHPDLSIDSGVISYTNTPNATTSTKGVVEIGSGLNIDSGVLSVDYPVASTSTVGLLKIGSNVNLDGEGTISLNIASATEFGVAQIGTGFARGAGFATRAVEATNSSKGVVEIGNGLAVNNGVVEFDTPTSRRDVVGLFTSGQGTQVASAYNTASIKPLDGGLDSNLIVWDMDRGGTLLNMDPIHESVGRQLTIVVNTNGYNLTLDSGYIPHNNTSIFGVTILNILVIGEQQYLTTIEPNFI